MERESQKTVQEYFLLVEKSQQLFAGLRCPPPHRITPSTLQLPPRQHATSIKHRDLPQFGRHWQPYFQKTFEIYTKVPHHLPSPLSLSLSSPLLATKLVSATIAHHQLWRYQQQHRYARTSEARIGPGPPATAPPLKPPLSLWCGVLCGRRAQSGAGEQRHIWPQALVCLCLCLSLSLILSLERRVVHRGVYLTCVCREIGEIASKIGQLYYHY